MQPCADDGGNTCSRAVFSLCLRKFLAPYKGGYAGRGPWAAAQGRRREGRGQGGLMPPYSAGDDFPGSVPFRGQDAVSCAGPVHGLRRWAPHPPHFPCCRLKVVVWRYVLYAGAHGADKNGRRKGLLPAKAVRSGAAGMPAKKWNGLGPRSHPGHGAAGPGSPGPEGWLPRYDTRTITCGGPGP